jgi:GDP-L-fucose synthase
MSLFCCLEKFSDRPMTNNQSIFLAGHRGMVGRAIERHLRSLGHGDILTRTRQELDLLDQEAVFEYLKQAKPHTVILAAARVGGIEANRAEPAQFLYENLAIQNHIIHGSMLAGVKRMVFLGSSCIYPRECPQPMKEEHLLSGPLEPTNEGYALAKIAGLRMTQYYHKQYGMQGLCPMPCNLYGTGDSFDPQRSHVLSALVKRFVDAADAGAEKVVMWGTGSAKREFLHVDDLARAVLLMMEKVDSPEIFNVGCGEDISIRELAEKVAAAAGYQGRLEWDSSKPDGMPRKCLDVSKIKAIGFEPQISLDEGIRLTMEEYRQVKQSQPQG